MMIKKIFAFGMMVGLPLLLVGGLLWQTAVAAPTTSAARPDWTTAVPLTTAANTPNGASRPVIAAAPNGPTVTVVFNRQTAVSPTATDPWFRQSFNNGLTWTVAAPIYSSAASSLQLDLLADGSGHTHAVWREENKLAYMRGDNWGSDNVLFITTPSGNPGVSTPAIASNSQDALAIVWSEGSTNAPTDIYYTQSSDGGLVWDIARPVFNSAATSLFPAVAVDEEGVLHVVWEEHDQPGDPNQPIPGTIYYSHSIGATWSEKVNLSTLAGVADGRRPEIMVANNGLHIAFTEQQVLNNTDIVQRIHYAYCETACSQPTNWQAAAEPVSGAVGLLRGGSDVTASLGWYQGCTLVYYHGIPANTPADTTAVYGASSCDNWAGRDRVTAAPAAGLVPSLTGRDGLWAFLAYESPDAPNQIQVVRNAFKLFAPLVEKSATP